MQEVWLRKRWHDNPICAKLLKANLIKSFRVSYAMEICFARNTPLQKKTYVPSCFRNRYWYSSFVLFLDEYYWLRRMRKVNTDVIHEILEFLRLLKNKLCVSLPLWIQYPLRKRDIVAFFSEYRFFSILLTKCFEVVFIILCPS